MTRFLSTAYGPPWTGINGTGVTATGVDLRSAPHRFIVAVDPTVIPLHTRLTINPNPFGGAAIFQAEDTGSAIKGLRIDFYDWRGRTQQYAWGRRNVEVTIFGAPPTVGAPTAPVVKGPGSLPNAPSLEGLPGGAPTAYDYSHVIRASRVNLGRMGAYLRDAGDAIRRLQK